MMLMFYHMLCRLYQVLDRADHSNCPIPGSEVQAGVGGQKNLHKDK